MSYDSHRYETHRSHKRRHRSRSRSRSRNPPRAQPRRDHDNTRSCYRNKRDFNHMPQGNGRWRSEFYDQDNRNGSHCKNHGYESRWHLPRDQQWSQWHPPIPHHSSSQIHRAYPSLHHQPYSPHQPPLYHQSQLPPQHIVSNDVPSNTHHSFEIAAKFDISKSLNVESTPIVMRTKLLTFYKVNPPQQRLMVDEDIKPMTITMNGIQCLQNVDFKQIAIDYSNVPHHMKDDKMKNDPQCLSEQLPPPNCRMWNRTDPFVYEMVKVCNSIHLQRTMQKQETPRFITFRHNLRAIANMTLYHLYGLRIYDRCGINIGIHRNGMNIFLENILEKKREEWREEMIYGNLLEHTLEELCTKNDGKIGAMDYQRVLDRNEIRAFNVVHFGEDIECLCAAEMDAVMKDEENGQEKVIEIKSSKMRNVNHSKMKGILDWKLLKYWTQCKFGGVDAVLIVFHENGVVQRTELVDTVKLEQFFPRITSKCIQMVYEVLKWIQNVMIKLPERTLYRLAFAKRKNDTKNTEIILQEVRSETTQERVCMMLNGDEKSKEELLNHGLTIEPFTGVINVESV